MPSATVRVPSLPKRMQSTIRSRAKRLGIDPGEYALRLLDVGLDIVKQAESQSFAQIMRHVRATSGEVSDKEIVQLVSRARNGRG